MNIYIRASETQEKLKDLVEDLKKDQPERRVALRGC